MNIRCLLGNHNYERVSEPVPVKHDGDFSIGEYDWHYALGRCRRCRHFRMIRCGGALPYYPTKMKTEKEWLGVCISDYLNFGKEEE